MSLRPWGSDTAYIEGYDDGGKEYHIPDGFRVGESVVGSLEWYDDQDNHVSMFMDDNDEMPVLIAANGDFIKLKLAE